MYVMIYPSTYTVRKEDLGQNPYSQIDSPVNRSLAIQQHRRIATHLPDHHMFTVHPVDPVPDITYIGNGGFSLPHLSKPVVILPWMKYEQRRNECKYLNAIYQSLGIETIQFPGSPRAPFEGGADAKWFHNGKLLVVGYGQRGTKESVIVLRTLLRSIYMSQGVSPPVVIGVKIQSSLYYHLDLTLAPLTETDCIINSKALSPQHIQRLKSLLGKEHVYVLETPDAFATNLVVTDREILTHQFTDPTLKPLYEKITGKTVRQFDTSEFEKGGGSVSCLVMPIYENKKRSR